MKPRLLGEKWKPCARCGRSFPMGKLQKNKQGRYICSDCWDSNEGEK